IAFKRKKDSSISVALTLHRLDNVDAVVSAGNTGAVVATSMIALSRIEGILRPVIGSILPTRGLPCLLMDVGANPDCRAIHLLQFGIMGSIYMQEVIGIDNPPVGLLSIGSEDNKGNELTLFANTLFSESHLNFIGNIEGSDLLSGKAAVAVCDGFTGNLILKFAESFPAFLAESIKVSGNGSAAEAVRLIDAKFNPDDYGGVPILGVNGISVVCHGNASPKAITSAVKAAVQAHHSGINEIIRDKVSEVNRFYAMNKYFQHLRDRWEKRRQRIYMNPRRFFNWFSDKEPEKD
ncbi:MAG: phosphate acyltransferase, partial [FCB group bacterium]|nr:phosphate acyltransferase [FCB group bacterium]